MGAGRRILGTLLLALALAPPVAAETPAPGPAAVIDGDSIELDGRRVDFWGVDAPELGQLCGRGSARYRCGLEAAATLNVLVSQGPVACRPTPLDTADGGEICAAGLTDLAEAILRRGYAVTRPGALALYRRAEEDARRGRLGIWRGDFVPPAAWRAGTRLAGDPGAPVAACGIKGLIGDGGARIYLVPSDPGYAAAAVDGARGERVFCSDDAAEAAGWRRFPREALDDRPAGP